MSYAILVADDEQLNRQVILDILTGSGEGYSVLSANNGRLACQIASKINPDLILMDWNMPEMSGIEAVKQLKSNKETKDIPILMVTSLNASEKLQEAFDAGVADYITKPVKKIELLARVRAVLKINQYYKEILLQKEEIQRQKTDITDSISYAQNIQKAILPQRRAIYDELTDAFVLFKPKDVVSGDFYWFYNCLEKEGTGKKFIAANDCTGHGVPGAFVSMIGYMLLNQTVIEKGIQTPGEILTALDRGMKTVFTREDKKLYAQDGMDMALCTFDKDFKTLEFAGAQNPLYLIRNNELTIYAGDKRPIGGSTEPDFQFSTHTIELQKGDSIYIFSDGFADQFGGPRGKKLKLEGFRQLLLNNQDKSMKEQKQILDIKIKEWKGNLEQVDDMLVIGIRI